jgi:hypothetical protein
MGLLVALCSLATDLDTDVLSVDLIASVGGRPDERQRGLARLAAAGLIAREAAGVRLLVRIVDGDEGAFDDDGGEPEEHDSSAPRARPVLTDSERKERERERERIKKARKRERLRNASPSAPSLSPPSCPPSVPPGASPLRPLPVPPSSPVDASPSASPSLSEKPLSSSPERETDEGDAKGDEGGRREVPAQTDGRTALALADADTPPAWAHQEAEIRALGTGIKVDVPAVWSRFVAHAVGEGRTAASWRALWRNWLANERPPSPGRAPRAGIIKQKSAPDAPWLKAGKAS